jgi:uncharacterized protein (DUF4415 family)
MQKKKAITKPWTNNEGEVRELAAADFREMVPFSELPESLRHKLTAIQKRGRPKSKTPKQMIAFRFSPDVLDGIKALGRGYNVRVENLLRKALEKGQI